MHHWCFIIQQSADEGNCSMLLIWNLNIVNHKSVSTRSHSRVERFIDDGNCGLPHSEQKRCCGDCSGIDDCTFSRASHTACRSTKSTSELNSANGTISAVMYQKSPYSRL